MKLTAHRGIRSRRASLPIRAAMVVLLVGVPVYAQRGNQGGGQPPPLPGGAAAGNPFARNPQAVVEGQEIYNRSCTACHGKDGSAGDRALALGAPARRYARRTDADIHDAIMKGIPGSQMPPSGLNDTDAWKVTSYIRGLRGTASDAPAAGDVAHGEQIFLGKGQCSNCHMIKGKGGLSGPDLSNIAGTRKIASIVAALTKVQHKIATDGGTHDAELLPLATYQPVRITTADGKTITGVLKNEDSFSLQVLSSDNALHLLDRAGLKEVFYIPKSIMPTDFDKQLTPAEFQDLMAFLTRQVIAAPQVPGRPGRPAGE
jgi:cytochrome c oxidase cbb3-type subunit 3